ncbi:hypothetical protein GCM10008955_33130 [Deinococcus malanensis]|uniref:Uncharacterized protein n=1 Tax=Deinococcus malanensis TaxID=1706855 RepID=A0ABQ2F0T0_9DEIO|nr:hypothetical protein [Deinococcus malanensis]GGK36688.1 hypothetical protein GCM10008955_33130 [Deinococcus malanensis]
MYATAPVRLSRRYSYDHTRPRWPHSQQYVIDAIKQHADEHGITRVNTVEFGPWITRGPAASPHRAYAVGSA